MRHGFTLLAITLARLSAGPVAAQTGAGNESPTAENPPPPQECNAPEHRQFDFWVGEWDVTDPDGKPAGANRITRILEDCVLIEEWTGASGTSGKSFNIWSRGDRKWHQTWVSDTGTLLQLEGELKDGAMVMEGVLLAADGSAVRNRITWLVIDGDGDRVRQHWQQSGDDGRTWTTAFDGTYTRVRAEESVELAIRLEHESEAEALMARQLDSLLTRYDLEPWVLTRAVIIDERSIPHSHPVLTLHTRHIGNEPMLLSTFLHEQLHWLEEARPDSRSAAIRELRELFPEVPASSEGGARDEDSTYLHLLVCDLEYQAMTAVVGADAARETLARITHYEWIYDRVLTDPRIRQVSLRHGFDVRDGIRGR